MTKSKTNAEILIEEQEKLEYLNSDIPLQPVVSEFVDTQSDFKILLDSASEEWLNAPASKDVLAISGTVDADDNVSHAEDLLSQAIAPAAIGLNTIMNGMGIKTSVEIQQEEYTERLKGLNQ